MNGFIGGVLAILVIWGGYALITSQNEAYAQRTEFAKKCAEAGGIVGVTPSGWVHELLTCGGLPKDARKN